MRIRSIDIVRGAVMALMAIDHVRVYSGLPAGGPTAGIFFTRWVTHFCAPAFVFLAGTSAFLYRQSHGSPARFLLTRGLWLVALELTVLRVAWTFNLDFAHYLLAGVIWVIGWSMIVLAALVRLPPAVVGWGGVAVMALHNAVMPGLAGHGWLGKLVYLGFFEGPVPLGPGGPDLMVLYSLVPWVGVMAAGYGFGAIISGPPERWRGWCLRVGLGATALFVALRASNLYGDPGSWSRSGEMPALLSFLNTSKYPASLQFLLMTLGPTIALLPVLEGVRGRLAGWLDTFGRVPMFYYLLHIPLIHGLALVVSRLRTGRVDPWLFANHPMGNPPPPDGYAWDLGTLYLVWAAALLLLYPACRWYGQVKSRSRARWLSYL